MAAFACDGFLNKRYCVRPVNHNRDKNQSHQRCSGKIGSHFFVTNIRFKPTFMDEAQMMADAATPDI